MTALQKMHEAIGECEANQAERDTTSAEFWDKAAASIIGHLEGTENGGSNDGMLFFALAKQHCEEFETCSSNVNLAAEVNDKIVSLLYAGRGAVLSRSCSQVRKATNELEPLLLVPVIQATLSASERLVHEGIKQKSLSSGQVEAHAVSSVVVPLIEDVDRAAALKISENLALSSTPFRDGLASVVEAFFLVYGSLGLTCDQIGRSDGVDACNGTMSTMDAKTITGIAVGTTLAVLACCGIGFLLMAKRRTARSKNNDPLFKTPTGELNHTDDLLTKSPGEISCSSGLDGGDDYPEEKAAMINKTSSDELRDDDQEVV